MSKSKDEVGMLLIGIGWFGAGASMLIHIIGIFANWWAFDGVTWIIPLLFFAVMQVGNILYD